MNQCFQDTFAITGTIFGTDGNPVSGIVVQYTVDGVMSTVVTNSNGEYILAVPRGSTVSVSAAPGVGVTVSPSQYFFPAVCGNIVNRNFRFSVLGPALL